MGLILDLKRYRGLLASGIIGIALLLGACAPTSGAGSGVAPKAAHSTPAAGAKGPLVASLGTAHDDSAKRTAAIIASLNPVRLIVPKLGLDARILSLGPDATGAMQAPRNGDASDPIWSEVYWWNVGALPGQVGNAVIAGHVNRPDASPSTFTHLDRLVPGDTLAIVTQNGQTLNFVVRDKNAPLVYVHGGTDPTIQRIFGPATTPNLNLLTCWGEWDGTQFNRRLVVYATLVGVSPFPAASGAVTFH